MCAKRARSASTCQRAEPPLARSATARLGRFGTAAGGLPRGSASPAESARPAKTGSGASALLQEAAWRVAPASTRRRRGQTCVSHARRLRSVRRTRIAAAAVATRKAPAQIAEAVLLVRFAPSAKRSRRDAVPRAHLARSRPAQDLRPVVHAWLAATLAHIKATAQQAQGLWSVQIAQRLRGFIAQRVPRTGAHLQGQPAQLGISVTGVPETSRCVPSVRDGSAPPKPSQPTAPNAPLDTTARERQPARRPVQEARLLRLKARRRSQRAPTVKRAQVRLLVLRYALYVSLER
jgi:hypothetical protein